MRYRLFARIAFGLFLTGIASTVLAGLTYAIRPTVSAVKSSSPTEFEITYEWYIDFTPTSDNKVYVHFTDSNGVVKFKDEFMPDPAMTKWGKGKVKLAARKVTIPEKVSGPFEIRMGTMNPDNGAHDAIAGSSAPGELKIRVGKIKIDDGKVVFEEIKPN